MSVREDVEEVKKYLFDKKNGPAKRGSREVRDRCKRVADTMEEYVSAISADKKNINENKSADIAAVASSVRKFYAALHRGSDPHDFQKKIYGNIVVYVSGSMESVKKQFQNKSSNPFMTWLTGRLTIHRVPAIITGDLSEGLFDMADGINMKAHLKKMMENPETYTKDIANAVDDMADRFAREKTDEDTLLNEYMSVLTEEDVIRAKWIAERIRDYVEKSKPFDYRSLYRWMDDIRHALTTLLANIIILLSTPGFKGGVMKPRDIRYDLNEAFRFLQKLFVRNRVQQLQQRILTTDIQEEQVEDFSASEFKALKTNLRLKKQHSKKKPKPPAHSKTPLLQTKTMPLLQHQQAQQAQQQQKKLPARPEPFHQWFKSAPLIQPTIAPNPSYPSLLLRKQANIQSLKDEVGSVARTLMEMALASGADSIILVDVRNLGTKRHPHQGFQQKFRLLFQQADTLLQQQAKTGQKITKPFFVFVDQGDLSDGPIVLDRILDRSVRVKVSCFKQTDSGQKKDCHTTYNDTDRKNPMDDYVLLSLYSILSGYYQKYMEASGGVKEEMEEIQQFMRRNPGVARYSPDMVREYKERMTELRQINKNIAKGVPRPHIISDDLYRDWRIVKK